MIGACNVNNCFATYINSNKFELKDVVRTYSNAMDISRPSNLERLKIIYDNKKFGNDIIGPWISPENFFHLLAHKGLGWKDIHCSSIDRAEKNESYLKYIDIDNKIEEKAKRLKSNKKKISKIKKIISNIFFKKKLNIK